MTSRRCRCVAYLAAGSAVVGLSQHASADDVFAGYDYFSTVDVNTHPNMPTFFEFDGGFGVVRIDLMGDPIDSDNLYNTDTIVRRLEDAVLPDIGSSDTIDIEMVALSLRSIEPIDFGGTDFDVFITLDQAAPSLGSMTIFHDFADNGTNDPEGRFDSLFSLNLDVRLAPVGGGQDMFVDIDNYELEQFGALWTHTLGGKPDLPGESNFYLAPRYDVGLPFGWVKEVHPTGLAGEHNATGVVPSPATAGLLLLAGVRFRRRRVI